MLGAWWALISSVLCAPARRIHGTSPGLASEGHHFEQVAEHAEQFARRDGEGRAADSVDGESGDLIGGSSTPTTTVSCGTVGDACDDGVWETVGDVLGEGCACSGVPRDYSCTNPTDIVFVLDESSSISVQSWELLRAFVAKVGVEFVVGQGLDVSCAAASPGEGAARRVGVGDRAGVDWCARAGLGEGGGDDGCGLAAMQAGHAQLALLTLPLDRMRG